MLTPEMAQKQLAQWRIEDEDDGDLDESLGRVTGALGKLPKKIQPVAFGIMDLNEKGESLNESCDDDEERERIRTQSRQQFDKWSAGDRAKVFAAIAPKMADVLEAAWQNQKRTPYQVGYSRRAFRAARNPELTLGSRSQWLETFASAVSAFQEDAITPQWLAQWAPHAFRYRMEVATPVLAAAIDAGGGTGDEVFDILYKTVTREHEVGIMGEHVIQTLLTASRPDGWELMEKTLLAAQRQEGLRQSILVNVDLAHPEAFVRMMRVVLDKDLIRFSSVVQAVNIWLGLMWDSVSTKVMHENVDQVLKLIESPSERKKAISGSDAEMVYRGLWASAFEDAPATIPVAANLLKAKSAEVRFAATWILTIIGLRSAAVAKQPALDDENLQVAVTAAVSAGGIRMTEDMIDVDEGEEAKEFSNDAFERLERLYQRIPEKPTTLKPIVWPWTERKVERSMIAGCLLGAIGDRPPTKMLPYLKGLNSWQQQEVIEILAKQKKWDKLTRSTLFELAGHASADVREAAFKALEKQSLQPGEAELLEGYLTRKADDLRRGAMAMLLREKDAVVLACADRLTSAKDGNQRLAGLELLRQLAEGSRSRAECQSRGESYRTARKKLSKEEEVQVKAIGDSDAAAVTLDDALGLMNPAGRSSVVMPKKKKLNLITPAAIECLKSLDELIHKYRDTTVTVDAYNGKKQELFANTSTYWLPSINFKKPLDAQRKKMPLYEIWTKWNAERSGKLRDKDGLELLRAAFAAELFGEYDFDDLKQWMKKPERKKLAIGVLGIVDAPKLRYSDHVEHLINWLLDLEPPKGSIDFLLDCTENSYAWVPDEFHQKLTKSQEDEDYYKDEDRDWREDSVFMKWRGMLQKFLNQTGWKLSTEQKRRIWELSRFVDQPIPNSRRNRAEYPEVCEAVRDGVATYDDLVDNLLGSNRGSSYSGGFDGLSALTDRSQSRVAVKEVKGLPKLLDDIRARVLEIEVARGEAPTAATAPALALNSLHGVPTLFRVMEALDKGQLKKVRSWREDAKTGRAATLTHLLQITFPTERESHDEFGKRMKQAIASGYASEQRALELAFLAPQWTKFIEAFLGWNGFSEGLYWFIAHMNTGWQSNATEAAAGAEGLQGDPEDDEVEDEDDDTAESGEDGDGDEAPAPRKEKLSAWERLLLERTPLTHEERWEGAVDVAWFRRIWEELGSDRWKKMADAAKFAANAQQANKAQFLADVLLGNTKRKELIEGINKKKLKEYVRLLGLLPLDTGAKRDVDLRERYETMQDYRKYARGLSSLTKPAAMRASEIGMQNMARLAGYPDPLRLEWAMEAESVKDLAKGPVAITKDGVTVTLRLDDNAKPELTIQRDGKQLKTIPPQVKKKHAAIAELAERGTDLRRKASRMKQSLEAAMCRGDTFTGTELRQLGEHAILAPLLSRLVLIGEGIAGYPDKGGKALRDFRGKLEPVKPAEQLRIAHPHDLFKRGDWSQWQQECFSAERVQPFKQIFRELYPLTKQEKKVQASQRFAGHQVNPKQAMALWGQRGWNTQDGVFKAFHDLSLVADVSFQYGGGTPLDVEGLTISSIRFRKRDEYKPLPLSKVPEHVFSEVMRDIDLVVSVAHRGEVDPEASASTVEMRAALIRATSELLGLKNVKLKESHALIAGHFAQYSVHLGSGGVHRLPGGALCIIPVHSQHRGRLFLPFADDDPRTAEVVSKVLLLARDTEIQDPTILQQFGAPAERIAASEAAEAKATPAKKSSGKQAARPTGDAAAGGRRHFEFEEGKSKKFWEIEITGSKVTTRWGRIGSDGQSKTKSFSSEEAARKEYDKLIQEKTGKGYLENS